MAEVRQTEGRESPQGVRARTFAIGIVCVIIVCLIVGYGELVASRGGSIDAILLGANHMPPAAIGVLIIILFGNALLMRINPLLRLRPGELAIIYFMMVCAALLSSFGLLTQLLPNLIAVNYFADSTNNWRTTFFQHIKPWLVPWDPKGPEKQFVSRGFYEGLHLGEALPWRRWIVPLAAWTLFAFLFFFLSACIATLVRRRWADGERLTFPLVQLPLEMVSEKPGDRFLRNKLMWLGLAVPVFVHSLNGLHRIIPNVPELRMFLTLGEFLVNKPWSDMTFTPIVVSFSVVGFSYLLPLDVSFSFWFFLLFSRLQDVIGSSLGYTFVGMPLYPTRAYHAYQAVGAFFAIVISMLVLGKSHWRLVLRRVFRRSEEVPDADEFMSYRAAFWGGAVSFALMVVWLVAAGMNPFVALFMLGVFVFVVVLVMSRCVSEVGLLMLQPVFLPADVWAIFAPKAALGAANLAPLALVTAVFMRDPRTLMPSFLDAMKMADGVGVRKRSFAFGMAVAVGVGLLAAYVIQLKIIYHYGGLLLNTWFFRSPPMYFNDAATVLIWPDRWRILAPSWFAVGAVFTFFLYAMRSRFWWWPFHPLGYAMGTAWPAMVYWVAFLTGWLLKSLILRYGGAPGYRLFRPFFLGLIFGEFVAAIIWAMLTALLHISGPMIPIS